MSRYRENKFRAMAAFRKGIGNPLLGQQPAQTLLGTTGRDSGLPRRTPVGGRLAGREFWWVSEYGDKSQYARDILARPEVRIRVGGRWYTGVARPLPEDDARARFGSPPRFDSGGPHARYESADTPGRSHRLTCGDRAVPTALAHTARRRSTGSAVG